GCSGQPNEHSHDWIRQHKRHDLSFRNESEARAGPGSTEEPNHKAVHIRQRKNNMQITSLWMRCIAAILVVLIAQSAVDASSAKATLVEVWSGGDDGLTLRFRATLENAFKSSSAFALSSGKKPGTLIVTIPTHVEWKQVGKRTKVVYAVDFASVDNQPL